MTQKELFDKLQEIINYAGVENAIFAVEIMYESYHRGDMAKDKNDMISHIKKELVELLLNAGEYKVDREFRDMLRSAFGFDKSSVEHKKISEEYRNKNLEVEDKSTMFYNKTVVFTGDLTGIKREVAAEYIHSKGASVKSAVSSKTDIVVIGSINPGPEKLKKIEALIVSGANIQKMMEEDFLKITGLKA
jgi:NAD-dependent DNA ligase